MGRVELTINPDGTLNYEWTGRPGTGSLYQLGAERNHKLVNALGLRELWCVMLCVRFAPHPLGKGERAYRRMLEMWDGGGVDRPDIRSTAERERGDGSAEDPPAAAMGRLRKWIVERAGGGCNAPTDSYLEIAHDIATTGEVRSDHRY